jgi:hypothetical protein
MWQLFRLSWVPVSGGVFLGWGLQVGEVNGSKSIVLRPVPYTRGLSLLVAVGGVKRFFGHVIPGCLSDLRSLWKKLLVRV